MNFVFIGFFFVIPASAQLISLVQTVYKLRKLLYLLQLYLYAVMPD